MKSVKPLVRRKDGGIKSLNKKTHNARAVSVSLPVHFSYIINSKIGGIKKVPEAQCVTTFLCMYIIVRFISLIFSSLIYLQFILILHKNQD